MTGYLILENGEIFEGERIGYNLDTAVELVVNNENFGYIETITSPTYYGRGVVFTYPIIGNYGIIPEYCESDRIWASAIFMNEIAEFESNIPSKTNFDKYLRDYKIPGLSGLDVNKLNEIIRREGNIRAYLTSSINNIDEIMDLIKKYKPENSIMHVTTKQIKTYGRGKNKKIALLDLGFKHGIVNLLLKKNMEVTIFPANTSAETILNYKPDGIIISNGPGCIDELEFQIKTIKRLLESKIPILGIELGHLLIGIANGFKCEKLKTGCRGINYTVKNIINNKLYVTSQNHDYIIDKSSINKNIVDILFKNLNDNEIAGLIYKDKSIISVQFEPEACPGPLDTNFVFDDFIKMI